MKQVKLIRFLETSRETMGYMKIGDIIIWTLELPWKDNQPFVSCIPVGTYLVKKRFSERHKFHYHITGVSGRTWILIHAGNYHTDIQGCILPGKAIEDLDFDCEPDVKFSKAALNHMLELGDEFELTIESRC